MHSPLHDTTKLKPLVNMSANSALTMSSKSSLQDLMQKDPSPLNGNIVRPLARPSPASAALDGLIQSSLATAALDQMMEANRRELKPATTALEESMRRSSVKRMKRCSQATPGNSLASFTFGTTDVFQALGALDDEEEACAFPTLSWDLDELEEEEEAQEDDQFVSGLLGKRKQRKSLSTSCLLGNLKKPRGGLVRVKSMKQEVDRLVSRHQGGIPWAA